MSDRKSTKALWGKRSDALSAPTFQGTPIDVGELALHDTPPVESEEPPEAELAPEPSDDGIPVVIDDEPEVSLPFDEVFDRAFSHAFPSASEDIPSDTDVDAQAEQAQAEAEFDNESPASYGEKSIPIQPRPLPPPPPPPRPLPPRGGIDPATLPTESVSGTRSRSGTVYSEGDVLQPKQLVWPYPTIPQCPRCSSESLFYWPTQGRISLVLCTACARVYKLQDSFDGSVGLWRRSMVIIGMSPGLF